MEPHFLVVVAALAGLTGGFASLYMSLVLRRAGALVSDKGLTLASAALIVYAIAVLLESIVNLLAPAHLGPSPRRPQEILTVVVNRGTLIAIPLYTIAYSLMAISHYVTTFPTESRRRLYAIPVFILLFIDYNIVDLIVLAIAALLVLSQYGVPRQRTVAFYLTLVASHLLPLIILTNPNAWWAVPASTILRGVAPLILFTPARGTSSG